LNIFGPETVIEQRLQNLESHLKAENPVLLEVVAAFRELDKVAYRMGVLQRSQSFATLIPWWPLISILGTFSAGKSTFINYYLQNKLQASGNQAVDDKYTVICHSKDNTIHTLPGLALDADPRFPFYQISEEIEKVAGGEGKRIDAYLQLKTCPSDQLLGKILIDSPGFDADEQRTSTLRITEHIVNLSDLVLVFFDARHPEPGAMQDTLQHLVAESIHRSDSNKFLYILNQIDTTAREDNPEEVFGAWQRALAQKGLTAGRFYTIYNPDVSVPIDDPNLRERFESKRDADLAEINQRIAQVEIERAYRIIGALEKTARDFEERVVPVISSALERWRKRTLLLDAIVFGGLFVVLMAITIQAGYWSGFSFNPPWLQEYMQRETLLISLGSILFAGMVYIHFQLRKFASHTVKKWLGKQALNNDDATRLKGAFTHSTRYWRSLYSTLPRGWGRGVKRKLARIIGETDQFVQKLNDRYASPSGEKSTELPRKGATDVKDNNSQKEGQIPNQNND
jgi:GTPase SAR1 family protein